MDPLKKEEYSRLLLKLVPESGENVGNVSLRNQLQAEIAKLGDSLSEEEYWPLRDSLIDQGLIEQGRGRGGSVHRVEPTGKSKIEGSAIKGPEAGLYRPFYKAITTGYTKDNRIKRFISEITALQGRRSTGGRWTRPDVTLVAVRTYQFTPGKRIEVVTFEVKPDIESAFEGVYEALAHSAFAHRSFLAVHIPNYQKLSEVADDRIVHECTRHGVGYIAFSDPADYNTYDIICSAKFNEPDPYDVDNFVRTQLSQERQDELRELL